MVRLERSDRAMLDGSRGEAARFAMSVIVRMAEAVGADELVSVEQAHIDACALMSQSSLDLVNHLAMHEGRVSVPTTLSMVSLDLENWEALGVPCEFAQVSTQIANAYLKLGCIPAWTCAPYQGYLTPRFGQQIAWGESNAVVYANSVLGARTNRYADYLDICAAITGRAPFSGLHCLENRRATFHLHLEETTPADWATPAAWAAFGSLVGSLVGENVPVIDGLPPMRPSNDMFKAFGAAAASAGSVGLFHIAGLTPEAPDLPSACQGQDPLESCRVGPRQLRDAWDELSDSVEGESIGVVILGCPHLSYAEFEALVEAIRDSGASGVHENVQFLAFASATSIELARRGGLLNPLQQFGVTLVRDTCPFHSPVVAHDAQAIMTNSGKCAYYAPGELDVRVHFGSLRSCVSAAVTGKAPGRSNPW
ncbi:aconitase X catalytic domain-containing protein [Candidatus Bipolaricaulota bacterium]|nr:aconitase X catalytic domain-containing protein [Candidatus Bipolaricaulota bacterium]